MSKDTIALILINVVVFIGIMFALVRSTGWAELAKHYRFQGTLARKQRWSFQSARMGIRDPNPLLGVERPLSPLRNALNVAVNEAGMHLSIFLLFRMFHPPLFVPWDHISTKACSGLSANWLEFHFRDAPSVVLRLRKSVGKEILKYAPRQDQIESHDKPDASLFGAGSTWAHDRSK
jgi:hypothetical protein